MKIIHNLLFIIIGILLYLFINNIEGLQCYTPFHDILGESHSRYNKLNSGSTPILLNDNLVLQKDGVSVAFPHDSKESPDQTFNDADILNVVCDPGDMDNPPWELSSGANKELKCKNPPSKVIITCHGGFISSGDNRLRLAGNIFGVGYTFTGTSRNIDMYTPIFTRMQVFTYLNDGDCLTLDLNTNMGRSLNNIMNESFNYDDVFQDNRQSQVSMNHIHKVYSEGELLSKLLMFKDSTIESLLQLTYFQYAISQRGSSRYHSDGDHYISSLSLTKSNWDHLTGRNQGSGRQEWAQIAQIYMINYLNRNHIRTNTSVIVNSVEMNIYLFDNLYAGAWETSHPITGFLDPFMGELTFVLFDDSSQIYLNQYMSATIGEISTIGIQPDPNHVLGEDTYTAVFSISKIHIEGIRALIKQILIASCVTIDKDKLSIDFHTRYGTSLNRLFPAGAESVELPLFSLNVLMTPMFVNPPSINTDGTENPYSLPGGEYTSGDIILVVLDIINQIKDNDGRYYDIYRDILKHMGIDNRTIATYIQSMILLLVKSNIAVHGINHSVMLPGSIFNILRDLWLPWGYNIALINGLELWEISGQVIFMLLQLFKQNTQHDYNRLDIHLLTCLAGNENDERYATMDYSWEYTWTDEEIATGGLQHERKIGPTCNKKSCQQTLHQIDTRINVLGKGDFFEVDEYSYTSKLRTGIHPEYKTKTYSRNDSDDRDDSDNVTMTEGQDESTKIQVNCKHSPPTATIECKYNNDGSFNYDESINDLDPRICEALNVSVEVGDTSVESPADVDGSPSASASPCGILRQSSCSVRPAPGGGVKVQFSC